MPEINKIGKITYDLSFDSEDNAYAFQGEVESFVQNELLEDIDSVFRKLDQKDKIIRIDFLELDLGRIAYPNCRNEIRERVKDVLYEKLRDEIYKAEQNTSILKDIISKEESETELLIHFLSKGELPWNQSNKDIRFNELFERSLKRSNDLLAWFMSNGKQPLIRRRLIEQFTDKSILELLKNIDRSNHEFYREYAVDLNFTYRKKPIPGSCESEFRWVVWEVILAFLFTEKGSHFNRRSFVEASLIHMASLLGIDYSSLLRQFLDVLNQLGNHHLYRTEFPLIIRELSTDLDKTEVKADERSEKERWLSHLQIAFKNGQTNFSQYFIDMAEKYADELIFCLQQMVLHQKDRLKLIELLSNTHLKKLIGLLQVVEKNFIIHFVENLQIEDEKNKPILSKSNFRKAKWELGLAYLFEERGSTFNRKEFVKYTIFGIANRYNFSHQELVLSLYLSLNDGSYSESEKTLLVEILEEMKIDQEEKSQLRKEVESEGNDWLEKIEWYEYLVDYLNGRVFLFSGKKGNEQEEASSLLLALANASPNLVSNFLTYVFSPDGLNLLMRNASLKFIHTFIGVCMKHYQSASDDNINFFLESVINYASTTNNKIAYYTRILTAILNSNDINLSEMLQEINQFEKNLLAMDVYHPIDFLSLRTHLFALIKGDFTNGLIQKDYGESWMYVLEFYPDRLKQIMQLIVGNTLVMSGFVKRTSNNLLIAILNAVCKKNQNIQSITFLFSILDTEDFRKSENWRVLFWENSIQTLIQNSHLRTEQQLAQIILKLWHALQDSGKKELVLETCEKAIKELDDPKQQIIAKAIKSVRSKIDPKNEKNALNNEQSLQKDALKFVTGEIETHYSPQQLCAAILSLLKEQPTKMADLLCMHFNCSNFWIKNFPESILLRIVYLLFPKEFIAIVNITELLWNTSLVLAQQELLTLHWQQKYKLLFESLTVLRSNFSETKFADLIVCKTVEQLPVKITSALLNGLERSCETKQKKEALILITALKKQEDKPIKTELTMKDKSHKQARDVENTLQVAENTEEKIYINNAGMVLANPYLPELFKRLNLIIDKNFKDRESAEKGIHILQYMVNESCTSPEYKLLLNKIICGVKTGIPIKQSAEITDDEKQLIDGLIQAMISNWKVIGSTSVKGFQESFLQREGILYLKDDCWHLQVEARAYDMLLDQLPWAFSTIKYPWMKEVLYVNWR